ncbi:MAG: hypothetical protein MJK04_26065, partial [Psychrosphaera sp.]|nr:hypothetical protein [Psychrosphaera sp.]
MINMKKSLIFALLLLPFVRVEANEQKPVEIPVLTGPYLGQKPPGSTPEIFAPGIVNTEEFIE